MLEADRRRDAALVQYTSAEHRLERPRRAQGVADRSLDRVHWHGTVAEEPSERMRLHGVVVRSAGAVRGDEVHGAEIDAGVVQGGEHGPDHAASLAIGSGTVR